MKNRRIETPGDAVKVVGTCSVTIVGSEIVAGGFGVLSVGTGEVRIVDSVVRGKKGAVSIKGTGSVHAKGSKLSGGVKTIGTGRFVDGGGNTVE